MSGTEQKLYSLMQEYYLYSVKDIKPEFRNPINMNQLSFYGFYKWLQTRQS